MQAHRSILAMLTVALGACQATRTDSVVQDVELRDYNQSSVQIVYSAAGRVILKTCQQLIASEPRRHCEPARIDGELDMETYLERMALDVGRYTYNGIGRQRLQEDIAHARSANPAKLSQLERYLANFQTREDVEAMLMEDEQTAIRYKADPRPQGISYEQLIRPFTLVPDPDVYCFSGCFDETYLEAAKDVTVYCLSTPYLSKDQLYDIGSETCQQLATYPDQRMHVHLFKRRTMACYRQQPNARYPQMPGTCVLHRDAPAGT